MFPNKFSSTITYSSDRVYQYYAAVLKLSQAVMKFLSSNKGA